MKHHNQLDASDVLKLIKHQEIRFGGNKKLKIYGTLHCKSGQRMKKENRVFFNSVSEALDNGYRPCGNCLKSDYLKWKNGFI